MLTKTNKMLTVWIVALLGAVLLVSSSEAQEHRKKTDDMTDMTPQPRLVPEPKVIAVYDETNVDEITTFN
jgi:tripartite-type tricarboxylate transporter receptor subunit TctC